MKDTQRRRDQYAVACTVMRGGSSKGVFFQEKDIPGPGPARDKLLMRIMGTPDPLQIDGLGGSRLITSKVAIVGPPTLPGADLDYTFAQIDIGREVIDYEGNCGNISAAVGPFAIDLGWVPASEPVTCVRIHNTNTGKMLLAHVPVADGASRVNGDFAIAGVPGAGAEILMDFRLTGGTKTAGVLPTGNPVDTLVLANGESVPVTICDLANVVVFVEVKTLGLAGGETPAALEADAALVSTLREIRGRAAQRLGFCEDWSLADQRSPMLPMLMLVAPPMELDGADLLARFFFLNRVHEAMSATGAVCLAAASRIPGTVVANCMAATSLDRNTLDIRHPSGVMRIGVRAHGVDAGGLPMWETLSFGRTARKIMDGFVYLPRTEQ
jgi:2-methylaconitate isomerase